MKPIFQNHYLEDVMINDSNVKAFEINTSSQFEDFKNFISHCEVFGIDIETSGLEYPIADLQAVSVYPKDTNKSFLFQGEALIEMLRDSGVLKDVGLIFHNGYFDLPFLFRAGFEFNPAKIKDTYVLANKLQYQDKALKHMAKDFGIIPVDAATYEDLATEVMELRHLNSEPTWDDIYQAIPDKALGYATRDAVITSILYPKLYSIYVKKIGTETDVNRILTAEFGTEYFLTYSTYRGVPIDQDLLMTFISDYQAELEERERNLKAKVRELMGWKVQSNILDLE